jgi:hypothetical protein
MPPSRNDIRNDITTADTDQPMPPTRNDMSNDISADADPGSVVTIPCPVCGTPFTPTRRQRYCTPACRQAAWRRRRPAAPTVVVPPLARRRDHTVYQCPDCGTRRLGQQWCPDCTHPAVRLDLGGLCPHCDEPITISDITDQHPKPTTSR